MSTTDNRTGGFLVLIDLTRAGDLRISAQESPPLTFQEVAQVKAFLRRIIESMKSEERRKKFELWINPNPPR